jgi:hypothetical protein
MWATKLVPQDAQFPLAPGQSALFWAVMLNPTGPYINFGYNPNVSATGEFFLMNPVSPTGKNLTAEMYIMGGPGGEVHYLSTGFGVNGSFGSGSVSLDTVGMPVVVIQANSNNTGTVHIFVNIPISLFLSPPPPPTVYSSSCS